MCSMDRSGHVTVCTQTINLSILHQRKAVSKTSPGHARHFHTENSTKMIRKRKRVLIVALVTLFLFAFWRRGQGSYSSDDVELKILKYDEAENPNNIQSKNKFIKTELKPDVKVYIYPLPEKFNVDILNCVSPIGIVPGVSRCYDLRNGGLGSFLYRDGELEVYRTHQFALEVTIHNQLLHSKYVTQNPEEADIFYIPSYLGTTFFCRTKDDMKSFIEELFNTVKAMPYFQQGKPHVSALAKIERELAYDAFPVLLNPNCRNVTYILIEKEYSETYRKRLGLTEQRVIVAPYPSYVHLNNRLAKKQTITSPSLSSRRVFMFLAASDRRTNPFRGSIIDQFHTNVSGVSFGEFVKLPNDLSEPFQVWLKTQECVGQQENITIDWMQNSVFCLQPHGDSPTRKSFYDSIQSGCVPVIFKFETERVVYPFQRVLNYSDFVVTIDAQRVANNRERVVDILKNIPTPEVARLHDNVLRVARQLQYSIFDTQQRGYNDLPYVDALDMIMQEVKHIYAI